ncbi:MAG TPA: DUF3137 domain-containing protein [Mobilitalea sp.]|nr:DUF3137 domain-containing protein [Mobilitalea sp.]
METIINDLTTKLKKLNSKRLGLLFLNIILILLFAVLYFKIAFYLSDHYNLNSRIIRYAGLPIIYFFYTFLKRKKSVFNQLYNEFIIEDVIRGFYPSWSYNKEATIDQDTIYQTYLVKKGSSIDITNNIIGDVGNTNFSFVELKVVKNQYLGARLPKKLFHGYFFVFDNNKVTESKLFVRPNMLKDFGSLDFGEKKIKTDSSEFDQRFATFSDDPVEARYILTPALMARVLDFESKYKNKISLLFYKDKLYIAFKEYKNLLEPSLHKRITVDTINRQMDIFKLLGLIVEELNIDNNIWMKENKMQGGL